MAHPAARSLYDNRASAIVRFCIYFSIAFCYTDMEITVTWIVINDRLIIIIIIT